MGIILQVENDFNGIRVDRFIGKKLNLTHSIICKLLRDKKILLNDKIVKELKNKLNSGDSICVNYSLDISDKPQKEYFVNKKIVDQIRKCIRYEDENLAIIDKPAGLATQSGGSLKYSLDDISQIIWPGNARIVHRLDKDTSGLIVIAKNRLTATKIADAFQNSNVQKEYLAVLNPIPLQNSGTIITNIAEAKTQGKMHKCKNAQEGKLSITDYEVLKIDEIRNIALVKFRPKTGRTHQIRLHASHIGCPIVGDFKYHGNCNLSKDLHLVAYTIYIQDITPKIELFAKIPNFFIINNSI